MKKKVEFIKYIGSASGNPGCNNGNYDVEHVVGFSSGETVAVYSCACGNGCYGSFPINLLKVGQEYTDEEWEELLFGEV